MIPEHKLLRVVYIALVLGLLAAVISISCQDLVLLKTGDVPCLVPQAPTSLPAISSEAVPLSPKLFLDSLGETAAEAQVDTDSDVLVLTGMQFGLALLGAFLVPSPWRPMLRYVMKIAYFAYRVLSRRTTPAKEGKGDA